MSSVKRFMFYFLNYQTGKQNFNSELPNFYFMEYNRLIPIFKSKINSRRKKLCSSLHCQRFLPGSSVP